MSYSYFQLDYPIPQIFLITMNRPKQHNAVCADMWRELSAIMKEASENKEIRVAIITGAGGKAFASGVDISEMEQWKERERHIEYIHLMEGGFKAVADFPHPVMAMIDGFCMGAGCELALVCDLRIASKGSKFGIPAAKLGIVLNYPMTSRLISLVGGSATKEMLFTGGIIDAERAFQIGLINRIVDKENLLSECLGLANQMIACSPLAVDGDKKVINYCLRSAPLDDPEIDEIEIKSFESEDHVEGFSAFLEKRAPVWKGR